MSFSQVGSKKGEEELSQTDLVAKTLYHHPEIANAEHRVNCTICDNALFVMKMILKLSEEKE